MPRQIPIQIGTIAEALRQALHRDIPTAWTDIKKIYDDPAEVPTDSTDLPYAVITQPEATFGSDVGSALEAAASYPVSITLRAKKPLSGLLRITKLDRVDALLALLTASPRYSFGENENRIDFIWFEQNVAVELSPVGGAIEEEVTAIWYEVTVKMVFEG